MARKKKKQRKKRKTNLYFELIGFALILFAIFSSGISPISEGVIPHVFVTLLQWLFGFWYIIVSALILFLGVYAIVKRQWPNFKSPRWIGFYILFSALLLFTHVQTFEDIIRAVDQNIFGITWDYYESYQDGSVSYGAIGAGMVGAFLFFMSFYLLSGVGAKVVASFMILVGLIMLTETSLTDLIRGTYAKIKAGWNHLLTKRAERKEERLAKSENEEVEIDDHTATEEVYTADLSLDEGESLYDPNETIDIETKEWTDNVNNTGEPDIEETIDESGVAERENESYILPPLQLLESPVNHSQQHEKSLIQSTVKKLEQTFQSFGVKAKVTKDALVIGAEIVAKLQTIVSRKISPVDTGVVTVGRFQAGTGFNIIANEAVLEGTIRYFKNAVKKKMKEELYRIVKGVCLANDATYKIDYTDGYPPVINHKDEAELIFEAAKIVPGVNSVLEAPLQMGAEDFSYYLHDKPGAFFFTGAGKEGENHPHHHPLFDIDERSMLIAAKTFAAAFIKYQEKEKTSRT